MVIVEKEHQNHLPISTKETSFWDFPEMVRKRNFPRYPHRRLSRLEQKPAADGNHFGTTRGEPEGGKQEVLMTL